MNHRLITAELKRQLILHKRERIVPSRRTKCQAHGKPVLVVTWNRTTREMDFCEDCYHEEVMKAARESSSNINNGKLEP